MFKEIAAAIILTAGLSSTGAVRAAEPGLVGAWSFGDSTGKIVADSSGNGNQGLLIAAGRAHAEWGKGLFEGALGFDGGWGSYVQVPTSDTLNSIRSAITVLVLAYPLDLWQPNSGHTGFIALAQRQWREERHPDQFYLGYGVRNGKLTYKWHVGLLGDDNELSLYGLPPDDVSPVTRRWVSIAGTYDGPSGRLALYVDGTLIGETSRSGTIRLDAESVGRPLALGAELNQAKLDMTSGSFDGYLGEVRLYNRALSAEEVAQSSKVLLASPL